MRTPAFALVAVLLAGCGWVPSVGPRPMLGEPAGPTVVLAEGEDGDRTWRYLAYRTADGLCTAIELGGGQRAEGCSVGPLTVPPNGINLGQSAGTDEPTFATGEAGSDVATVVIETRFDGTFEVSPFPAPPELGLPIRFFVVVLPEASHVVRYETLDAEGTRIGGAEFLGR